MENILPAPSNYGELGAEPFSDYLVRWPTGVTGLPESLIETWAHRHWIEFSTYWIPAGALDWSYESRRFSNSEITSVQTFARMMETLDYWGDQLMTNAGRQETWLAKYMLTHGTTPTPILVFEGGGAIQHPCGIKGEKMVEPYQLIEGHMRLAYLRGMHRARWGRLQESHEIWVATGLPRVGPSVVPGDIEAQQL